MAIGRALIIIFLFLTSLLLPKQAGPANESVPPISISAKEPISAQSPSKFNSLYYLEIPRLGVVEEIKENVDPFKMAAYMPVITDRVAQAGQTSDKLIYLFAHSSDFRYQNTVSKPIFARLHEVSPGDPIILNRFGMVKKFRVVKIETVAATNLEPLKQSPPTETLVLQTCWPPTNLDARLIVTAKPAVDLAGDTRALKN
jgi:LPXTG-site transpeptidase (sortase) family protein